MPEIQVQPDAAPEEVKLKNAEELVALRCLARPLKDAKGNLLYAEVPVVVLGPDKKPVLGKDGKPKTEMRKRVQREAVKKGMHIDCHKGGEQPFALHPNQFVRVRRGSAEFHLDKSKRLDPTNPLMLEILSVAEMMSLDRSDDPVPTSANDHDALVARAISLGVVTDESELTGVEDAALRDLLAPFAEAKQTEA